MMPKVHRSLDRRVEYQWHEDGHYSESGPFFAKYEIGVEECYRLALAWMDAYPIIRAAFVKKYPDLADSDDDEAINRKYQNYLARVGLQEREQVEEFSRAAPEHYQDERDKQPPKRLDL